jgi:hypothetical protein
VDKDRAASAGDAGTGVVIEFYDEVVKSVFSPQAVPLLIWAPLDMIIIPSVFGVFDPRVVWANRLGRQQGRRMRKPIGTPP